MTTSRHQLVHPMQVIYILEIGENSYLEHPYLILLKLEVVIDPS